MRPYRFEKLCVSTFLPALLLAATAVQAVIPTNVTTRNFFGTLTFNRPVQVAPIPGLDSNYVVLEQWDGAGGSFANLVHVRYTGGAWVKATFDTVGFTGTVVTGSRELGLLGIAFHPNYAQNHKYYLSYTPSYTANSATNREQVVEREANTAGTARNTAVATRVLISVAQNGNTQKGGHLAFGPVDGYLYIGLGDGGGTGDPLGWAQNSDSLQGKMLRINVNAPFDAGKQYAVPSDNPFVGMAGRPEIWAKGVRNPWRWTIHPTRNELWVGDVGNQGADEVSLVPKGANLGWAIREGASCYTGTTCTSTGLTAPVYTRATGAFVGGVFFTGTGQFNDTYIFGSNATIYGMRFTNGAIADQPVQIATTANVGSIMVDNRGRVLVTNVDSSAGQNITANTGIVLLLESPDMVPTALRHASRPNTGKPISHADIIRDRDQYVIKTLDGRLATEIPSGAFLAAKKGSAEPAQILTNLWD